MSTPSIVFIANPKSGLGKHEGVEEIASRILQSAGIDFEFHWTNAPGHARQLSQEAVNNGVRMVVAVGGDGSVNECGSALVHSDTALGIIPCGSGNGLARHLGIPLQVEKAIQTLTNCRKRTIDTAKLNGTPYLGVAGVGFDAHVGNIFSTFGKRGFLSYVRITLSEYRKYAPRLFKIEIDGKEMESEALLVAVANSSQFGNNARITPGALDDDGLLDIAVLQKFPLISGFGIARKLFGGQLDRSQYISYHQAQRVLIRQSDEIAHIDGEPFNSGKRLEFEVVPESLKVAVPRI